DDGGAIRLELCVNHDVSLIGLRCGKTGSGRVGDLNDFAGLLTDGCSPDRVALTVALDSTKVNVSVAISPLRVVVDGDSNNEQAIAVFFANIANLTAYDACERLDLRLT